MTETNSGEPSDGPEILVFLGVSDMPKPINHPALAFRFIASRIGLNPEGTEFIETWQLTKPLDQQPEDLSAFIGQSFKTYWDVRDVRCRAGEDIGRIVMGGKQVSIYQFQGTCGDCNPLTA